MSDDRFRKPGCPTLLAAQLVGALLAGRVFALGWRLVTGRRSR
jgi:hypothetical protein